VLTYREVVGCWLKGQYPVAVRTVKGRKQFYPLMPLTANTTHGRRFTRGADRVLLQRRRAVCVYAV